TASPRARPVRAPLQAGAEAPVRPTAAAASPNSGHEVLRRLRRACTPRRAARSGLPQASLLRRDSTGVDRPRCAFHPPASLVVQRAGHPVVEKRDLPGRSYGDGAAAGPAYLDLDAAPAEPVPPGAGKGDRGFEPPVGRVAAAGHRQAVDV